MKNIKRTFVGVIFCLLMIPVSSITAAASEYSPHVIKATGTSRVEAELWMGGGQGVAYYERTYQTDPRAYASPRGARPESDSDESKFVPQSQIWSGASNKQMLGWCDANEWVRYEIDVKSAGTYQVGVLVGTGYDNVLIDIYLDADPDGGTLLGTIAVENNGFYEMKLQSIGEVQLPQGDHTIKLLFRHAKGLGGLNLVGVDVDYIQFTRINTSQNETSETEDDGTDSSASGQSQTITTGNEHGTDNAQSSDSQDDQKKNTAAVEGGNVTENTSTEENDPVTENNHSIIEETKKGEAEKKGTEITEAIANDDNAADSNQKIIVIVMIVTIVLLVGALGVGGYFLLNSKKADACKMQEESKDREE